MVIQKHGSLDSPQCLQWRDWKQGACGRQAIVSYNFWKHNNLWGPVH